MKTPLSETLLFRTSASLLFFCLLSCAALAPSAAAQSITMTVVEPINYGKHLAGAGTVTYETRRNVRITVNDVGDESFSVAISTAPADLIHAETGTALPQVEAGINRIDLESCVVGVGNTYPDNPREVTVGTSNTCSNNSLPGNQLGVHLSGTIDIPPTAPPGLYFGCVYVQAHVLAY